MCDDANIQSLMFFVCFFQVAIKFIPKSAADRYIAIVSW